MRLTTVLLAACTLASTTACGVTVGGEDDFEEEDEYIDPGVQPGDSPLAYGSTVASVVAAGCSTAPVRGISLQIAEEMRCLEPDLLVPFSETANIKFQSAAVLPYLAADTAAALQRAAPTVGVVEINSSLRSIAQQYLIKRWRDARRCGITAAASPGRSNHETGRAVDLDNSSEARRTMQRMGFSTLRNDPVHFEHPASDDLRSTNVEAFQRLWNRNNPGDRIAVSGTYDTATASRLGRSPAAGFATGAVCD